MALSAPPPPPDPTPSTTTSTAAAAAASRHPFPPNPRHPPPHHFQASFYPTHPHITNSTPAVNSTPTLYPVASSGRGFLQKHPHSSVAGNLNPINPNSHLYPAARPGIGVSYPRPVFGYPHPDPGQVPGLGMGYVSGRSITQYPGGGGGGAAVMPGVIKGVPVSASASASSQPQNKIAFPSSSFSECNGNKDARKRGRDDSFVTIRDRKVRVSESAAVYALCRSWLQNCFTEESQPLHMDTARSLPRPLPSLSQDSVSPVKKDDPKEAEEEEGSVDNLTPEELLQTHIKRAKKVRSRFREERLQRIARYKTRLGLLLPLMVEQQLRNDSASGN